MATASSTRLFISDLPANCSTTQPSETIIKITHGLGGLRLGSILCWRKCVERAGVRQGDSSSVLSYVGENR